MGLWYLQSIAFCFYFRFIECWNILIIEVAQSCSVGTVSLWKRASDVKKMRGGGVLVTWQLAENTYLVNSRLKQRHDCLLTVTVKQFPRQRAAFVKNNRALDLVNSNSQHILKWFGPEETRSGWVIVHLKSGVYCSERLNFRQPVRDT